MKKMIIVLCVIAIVTVSVCTWLVIRQTKDNSVKDHSLPFEDVSTEDWFYPYLADAYHRGWVEGVSGTRFAGSAPLLRGDFAQMLHRYLGTPDVAGFHNPFKDLEGEGCKNAAIYLYKLGTLSGKSESIFAPYEPISREQLVSILYRLGGYKVDNELSPSGKYADRDQISPWAMDAVDWAIENEFLDGLTESILGPKDIATRAQGVKILSLYGKKANYKTDTGNSRNPITLTVWQAGVEESGIALETRKLLDRFEKKFPHISIDYTPLTLKEDPYDKIASALKHGTGPDVILASAPYEMLLADQGLILPLDTLLTDAVRRDINPALLIDCTYSRSENEAFRGKLVSAPLFATPRALLINRSIFRHFGIPYPDNDFQYADLLSNAENLTGSKDGRIVYGFGTRSTSPCLYLGMLWGNGATIVDPKTGLASTTSFQWEATTQSYLNLYEKELTPDYGVSMDYNSQLAMFAQGSVAMMDASLNAADLIQKQAGWETNLAVYPYLDGAESACLCVGEVAAIAHNSSHIVDAARLVNFLMDTDSQITYAENVGYLPGVMSALNSTDIGIDPYLSPYVAGIEDTKALGHKGFSVYCVIRDELQRVLRKEITVQEYCVSLESKINQILQN